jgi:hypothetical protein
MSDYRTFRESDRPVLSTREPSGAAVSRQRRLRTRPDVMRALCQHPGHLTTQYCAILPALPQTSVRRTLMFLRTHGLAQSESVHGAPCGAAHLVRNGVRWTPTAALLALHAAGQYPACFALGAGVPDAPTEVEAPNAWVHPIAAGTATALNANRLEPLMMDYADPRRRVA